MKKTLLLALLGGASACSTTPNDTNDQSSAQTTVASSTAPKVQTDKGPVQGGIENGTYAYYTIPFAKPPVGTLRWKAPQPADPWTTAVGNSSFPANNVGTCIQLNGDGSGTIGSEDCLYLNVWTPVTGAANRPVLFFVHGGGNSAGDTAEQANGNYIYDGALLASTTNSVVVTANYRVGVMGFMAQAALSKENAHNASGNYGLLDQQAALGWVQKNIAAFGGNPKQVLLFGQSAGALDTCALVASPLSTGLFAAAAMESGECGATAQADTLAEGDAVVTTYGCTNGDPTKVAACLRNVKASDVTVAYTHAVNIATRSPQPFGLAIDGWSLPQRPIDIINAGQQLHVPVLIGSNEDETAKQLLPSGHPANFAEYQAMTKAFVGGDDALMTKLTTQTYPANAYVDPLHAYIALTSDAKFTCPARENAKAFKTHQAQVYRYFYTHAFDGAGTLPAVKEAGAFHGAELLPLFGNWGAVSPSYNPSSDERALATLLDGSWSQFARSGNPSVAGAAVQWPLYDATLDATLDLNEPATTLDHVHADQCNEWLQANLSQQGDD